jgi:hypothetical protein
MFSSTFSMVFDAMFNAASIFSMLSVLVKRIH